MFRRARSNSCRESCDPDALIWEPQFLFLSVNESDLPFLSHLRGNVLMSVTRWSNIFYAVSSRCARNILFSQMKYRNHPRENPGPIRLATI